MRHQRRRTARTPGFFALALWAAGVSHPAQAENMVFPTDAGIVNVRQAPYGARGNGVQDDTKAIQKAIDDLAGSSRILYLPNGVYRVSDTLQWPLKNRAGNLIYGFTHIQGQSRNGVVIRLKDGAFPDPKNPRAVMNAGAHSSADWFACSVRNLSIDTGRGNAGAIGLQFFANNRGSVQDVSIRAGDGAGVAGLDLSYNDMNGPLLVKNLSVSGFGIGVKCGATVNSQTFEHIRLENQTKTAFLNEGQCISVRDLRSRNRVPAVVNAYGVMALVDAKLEGTAGAQTKAAISNGETLFARGIETKGYGVAIHNDRKGGTPDQRGPLVAEWVSSPVLKLFPQAQRSLGLPVRETPLVPWSDLKEWANVRAFGAGGVRTGNFNGNIRTFGGGDGYHLDQADWANARVVDASGKTALLVGKTDDYAPAAGELAWTSATNGINDYRGREEAVRINRSNGVVGPIVINRVTYEKGLGVHAPSTLTYKLDGKWKTFKADVGIDSQVLNDGYGSVVFQVWADGKMLFDSGVRFGNDAARSISVDVTGRRELKLIVDQGEDDTRAIQAAIDSGASTIYFPQGEYSIGAPLLLRGKVRRVMGCEANLGGKGTLRFVEGAAPNVVVERFTGLPAIEHAAKRTLILSSSMASLGRNTGSGDLFVEDVVSGPWTFNHQNVWARQLNVENEGTHIVNNGSALWILGLKTERGGTLIETGAAGKTEVLGGLCYTTSAGKLAPMFVNRNGSLSVTIGEVCYTGDPYAVVVSDAQGAETKLLNRGDGPLRPEYLHGSVLPLYISKP